jgi:molecular chaperone DnaK (HSP70)
VARAAPARPRERRTWRTSPPGRPAAARRGPPLPADVGIDFGTSNSVVANFQYGQAEAAPDHEGRKRTPSVVTLRRNGTLAFGQEARENFDENRSIRSIKRRRALSAGGSSTTRAIMPR